MRTLSLLLCVAAVIGGLGCRRPERDISKQWALTVRNVGIQPIYPPREDVQVGDIYFSRVQPDEENRRMRERGYVPLDLWVAHLSLKEELGKFYSDRLLFGETRAFQAGGGQADPSYLASDARSGRSEPRMARLVSFPAFATSTIARDGGQAELNRFVPTEVLSYLFRSQRGGLQGMTLGASMAESYGLPADIVFRAFQKEFASNEELGKLLGVLQPVRLGDKGEDRAGLRAVVTGKNKVAYANHHYVKLVTEIYQVRSLDITLRMKPYSFWDGYGQNLPFNGVNVERLNQQLERNLPAAASGGNVRFVSVGQDSVGLRRTFARPLVIGYRGVLVRINAQDRSAEMVGVIDAKPYLN